MAYPSPVGNHPVMGNGNVEINLSKFGVPANNAAGARRQSVEGKEQFYASLWNSPAPDYLKQKPKQYQEVRLTTNRNERFVNDTLADLYAILIATEHLETAYVRDCISNEEYNAACTKLIAQFRTAKDALAGNITSIQSFIDDFGVKAPAAYNRLEKIGVPATIEHGDHKQDKGQEVSVAATVHHFITTMDMLKLEMYAVDEVQPHVSDLMESLNNVSTLKPDDVPKEKVKRWLIVLNAMKATEELSADQARQMLFDLDTAYNAFLKHLEKKN